MDSALGQSELSVLTERLAGCSSQFDVFRYMRDLTQRFDFRYFVVQDIPREGQSRMSESVIITSAPSDLIKGQDEPENSAATAVLASIRKSGAPQEFRFDGASGEKEDGSLRPVRRVLRDYDLITWLAVPVFMPGRAERCISFLGNRHPVGFLEMAEIGLIAAFVNDRLSEVSATKPMPPSPLTERELECLMWTSAGKTSVEIAKILNLSEHTVNHYLNNATRKSGTVNRTQTVAYALRNGWIE